MPPSPFSHHLELACSWVPLSGESSLLSALSCQPWNLKRGQNLPVKTLDLKLCHHLPSALRGSTWAPPLRTVQSRHAGGGKQAQPVMGVGAGPRLQWAAVAGGAGTPLLGLPRCGSGCSPGRRGPQRRGTGRPPGPPGCGSPSQGHRTPRPHTGPAPELVWGRRETAGRPHSCAPHVHSWCGQTCPEPSVLYL